MKQLVTAVLAAACAIPAMAGNFYVSGSVGRSGQTIADRSGSASGNALSYTLAGGYQFDGNFGVEVGVPRFGGTTMEGGHPSGDSDGGGGHYAAVTGALMATDRLSVYAKAGLALFLSHMSENGSADINDNHVGALLGLGVGYTLTPKVTVFAEYLNFGKVYDRQGLSVKIDSLAAGVRYTF